MTVLESLFEVIRRDHVLSPPLPAGQVKELEAGLSYPLPTDWKEFYSLCNGLLLFDDAYTFVPLEEVRRVRIDIYGDDIDYDDGATQTWYSVCDIQDGNYIAADLASVNGDHCRMLDCFHEDLAPAKIIALSLTEFLDKALKSEGRQFWLVDYPGYGYTPNGGPPE